MKHPNNPILIVKQKDSVDVLGKKYIWILQFLFVKFDHLDSSTTSKTAGKEDPPDVLDKAMCLTALAELRHAKWFQVGRRSML